MLVLKPIALIVGLFLALLWAVQPSHAMSMCGKREDFIKALNDKYREFGIAIAIAGQINLVEVFKTASGSTWTILFTTPQGKTCIIAAGKDWFFIIPETPGEKS